MMKLQFSTLYLNAISKKIIIKYFNLKVLQQYLSVLRNIVMKVNRFKYT